jgi:outer membrane lipase/esterase
VSRYQFADDVHPTPYGHQLLAQFAASELAKAGWL